MILGESTNDCGVTIPIREPLNLVLAALAMISPPFRYRLAEIHGLDSVYAITTHNRVLGTALRTNGASRAALWSSGHVSLIDLSSAWLVDGDRGQKMPMPIDPEAQFYGRGIGDDGTVVGAYCGLREEDQGMPHPAIWKNGVLTVLDIEGTLNTVSNRGVAYGQAVRKNRRHLFSYAPIRTRIEWFSPVPGDHAWPVIVGDDGVVWVKCGEKAHVEVWTLLDGNLVRKEDPSGLRARLIPLGHTVWRARTWVSTLSSLDGNGKVYLNSDQEESQVNIDIPGAPTSWEVSAVGPRGNLVLSTSWFRAVGGMRTRFFLAEPE